MYIKIFQSNAFSVYIIKFEQVTVNNGSYESTYCDKNGDSPKQNCRFNHYIICNLKNQHYNDNQFKILLLQSSNDFN